MNQIRTTIFTIALLSLAILTLFSFSQEPRPYVQEPGWTDLSFWQYPLEWNTDRRVTALDSDLLTLFVLNKGPTVWVGGKNGVILKSTSLGASWIEQRRKTSQDKQEEIFSIFFLNQKYGWASVGAEAPNGRFYGKFLFTQNGGNEWQEVPRTAPFKTPIFLDLFFTDTKNGWAVVSNQIYRTKDGGKSWKMTAQLDELLLKKVQFSDSSNGWALSESGNFAVTSDGGKTWKLIRSPAGISTPAFINQEIGWFWENKTLHSTVDAGKTWQKKKLNFTIKHLYFQNQNLGWALTEKNQILSTLNGGKEWKIQNEPTSTSQISNLNKIYFYDEDTGWAIGDDGTILFSNDGGENWKRQTQQLYRKVSFKDFQNRIAIQDFKTILRYNQNGDLLNKYITPAPYVRAAFFSNETIGWYADTKLYRTVDAGNTWSLNGIFRLTINSIYFLNQSLGWLTTSGDRIFFSNDGGLSWEEQGTIIEQGLNCIYFKSPLKGWSTGKKGTILATVSGGNRWERQTSPVQTDLNSIHFINEKIGWITGNSGTILNTIDGGKLWQKQISNTNINLTNIIFEDSQNGYAYHKNRLIVQTSDGGKTWDTPIYLKFPAPWYYGILLILIAVIYFTVKVPSTQPPEKESIANQPHSDRPLETSDEDRLNFLPLALGLSGFIRNKNTIPPLTIAVTGEWGTGKSSLMNLVKENLEKNRFKPVFFNSWHHQQEEHLLAALLDNIRMQAIPEWWKPTNWIFRLRLFWIRSHTDWPVLLALAIVYGFILGFFWDSLLNGTIIPKIEDIQNIRENSTSIAKSLGFLVSTLTFIYRFFKNFKSFGEHPSKLLSNLRGRFYIRDIKAKTGYRYRFSKEFRDVTRAMGNRKMVIFIDDLDRCKPENVLNILEAINFLSTAGECVIIMGLALERVKKCVGLGFRDIAEEFTHKPESEKPLSETERITNFVSRLYSPLPPQDEPTSSPDGREKRFQFAEEYLKKLINVEVALPRPTKELSQKLLANTEYSANNPQSEQKNSKREKFGKFIKNILQKSIIHLPRLSALLLICGIIAGSFYLGFSSHKPRKLTTTTGIIRRISLPQIPSGNRLVNIKKSEKTETNLISKPEQTSSLRFLILLLPLLLLIIAAYYSLTNRQEEIIADKQNFRNAWDIWHPLVYAKEPTPRALKRFLNRIRYYAMRQRPQEQNLNLWEILQENLQVKKKQAELTQPAEHQIPEEILVALGAIQHYNPEWLDKWPEHIQKAFGIGGDIIPDESYTGKGVDILRDAFNNHKTKFGSIQVTDEYLAQLRFYAKGIMIR